VLKDPSSSHKASFTGALMDIRLAIEFHPMSFSPLTSSSQKANGPSDATQAKQPRAKVLERMQWPMRIPGDEDAVREGVLNTTE
jgi:hypothetical protein